MPDSRAASKVFLRCAAFERAHFAQLHMRSVARAAAAAASFDERKRRILSCRGDKSPKGSIDDLVLPIMDVVNQWWGTGVDVVVVAGALTRSVQ